MIVYKLVINLIEVGGDVETHSHNYIVNRKVISTLEHFRVYFFNIFYTFSPV